MPTHAFDLEFPSVPSQRVDVKVDRLLVAGWAGRDAGAVQHHIDELAALGIAPPSRTPLFYEVANTLLTTDIGVDMLGDTSSGEVEPFVVMTEDGLLVGVGSDHTDRKAEAWSVPHSKQLCAKPVAPVLWRHADVADHWDALVLRSWVPGPDGTWTLYQEGTTAGLRSPPELMALKGDFAPGAAMFCGTLAAIGGVRAAAGFRMELHDPVLGRSIRHAYDVRCLSVII